MDCTRDIAIVDRTIYKNSSLTLAPDSGLGGSLPVTDSSRDLSGSRLSEISAISGAVPVVGMYDSLSINEKIFSFILR